MAKSNRVRVEEIMDALKDGLGPYVLAQYKACYRGKHLQEMEVALYEVNNRSPRFAVEWFAQHGFDEGDYGDAETLVRAKNTAVKSVEMAGLVESGGGWVRLRHWSDVDPGWDPRADKRPTVWEGTHHLIERLDSHGEMGAARLLARMPDGMGSEARQLAYRLYHLCERKKWTAHGRDYNRLITSWRRISDEAARIRNDPSQMELL